MKTKFYGKHFLNTQDWSKEELETALGLAFDLKKKFALNEQTSYLLHKTLYLLFFFSSMRTRTSFEVYFLKIP